MPLPSFAVTGNLFDLLGNLNGSEINPNYFGAGQLSGGKVTFTSNVPADQFVAWEGGLYRVQPVVAEVYWDGTIKRNGAPVRLLANDAGLSVDDLQWTISVTGMESVTFDAPADGVTIDVAAVIPVASVEVTENTASLITAAVSVAVNALIDGAPGALDTLNELAAALNDDANFATTVTNALAAKQPLDADLTALAAMTDPAGKLAGIEALADVTDAANVAAAGAVMKGTLVFNPVDYGAVGDGTTNDTAAVESAYAAAVTAGGGVLILPRGYRFKITDGVDFTSHKVSVHGFGGWLTVGQIRVGDPTGTNDFQGVELRNILYDGEDAYGSTAKGLVLKGNCRGLKVVGGAFKNTGKCVSADDADGATGFHKLGKITFDGTQFQTCNYNIYVNTVEWDVCSDWRVTGLLGGDTTRIKNIYISGVDGIQIDTCVFFMADSASGYAYLTDKLHNVHLGETSQVHVHGNQFFVAGSSALRIDESWTMSITGNGFIWPGQITQGDCIELRGASSAGNLVGTIVGNTFNNWTRNAIGIYADTTTDASKLVISDNTYSQNLSSTTNLTGVTLTTSNCYRVYIHSSVVGLPRVPHLPSDIPVFDWWKTSDRPQGRNLRGTFYGGESTTIRRAVTINSATPVGIFVLSGGDTGNVYSGLIVVTARSSAISTAKETSYLLHVSRDGTRDPVVALVSAIGLTTGAAADEPSFTWTLGTDNTLTATRVGSTVSGTNWWFRMDSYGTVVGR